MGDARPHHESPPSSGLFYAMNQDETPTPDTALVGPTKPKRVKRSYTEADKERGLIALALAAGNARLAESRLTPPIPYQTLDHWARHNEADRYERITNEVVPQVHARLAADLERTVATAIEVQDLALAATRAQLQAGEIKDASTATRNLATVIGINMDKATTARGRPNTIIEHRAPNEILQGLATRIHNLTGQTVDATYEEIQDTDEPASPVQIGQARS